MDLASDPLPSLGGIGEWVQEGPGESWGFLRWGPPNTHSTPFRADPDRIQLSFRCSRHGWKARVVHGSTLLPWIAVVAGCVLLTWEECAMASDIGRLRQLSSIKAGRQDRHGFSGSGWDVHIEGACGEIAVAKYLGLHWSGGINTFKSDDLPGLQVRTRSVESYDLIVRRDDPDHAIFVLVTGKAPKYRICGWIYGGEAKQEKWIKTHGNRPPAYFVPQAALLSIEKLPSLTQPYLPTI